MSIVNLMPHISSAYTNPRLTDTAVTAKPQGEHKSVDMPAVVLSFSEEALAKAREARAAQEQALERARAEGEALRKQMENAKEQGEAMGKALEVIRKCMVIAMRIIKGDKVPKEDHKFLRENDLERYVKAIMLRQANDNPKKHKRVSEDEEESQGASSTDAAESGSPIASSRGEAPPAPDAEVAMPVD